MSASRSIHRLFVLKNWWRLTSWVGLGLGLGWVGSNPNPNDDDDGNWVRIRAGQVIVSMTSKCCLELGLVAVGALRTLACRVRGEGLRVRG